MQSARRHNTLLCYFLLRNFCVFPQAELDYHRSERAREKWEMQHNIEGEISEMSDILAAKASD